MRSCPYSVGCAWGGVGGVEGVEVRSRGSNPAAKVALTVWLAAPYTMIHGCCRHCQPRATECPAHVPGPLTCLPAPPPLPTSRHEHSLPRPGFLTRLLVYSSAGECQPAAGCFVKVSFLCLLALGDDDRLLVVCSRSLSRLVYLVYLHLFSFLRFSSPLRP